MCESSGQHSSAFAFMMKTIFVLVCISFQTLNLCVICLQITELLDDERCEAECEELPQDGEEAPSSPQHTETDDSPATR